ncbi:TPA: DNA helicase UvrD [Candidatus Bathyarchaeota archaeon]|nr:DNA helicase UvrD [Candidatus Bathyarchaeota archaeon]
MRIILDGHIHSKYSRATSRDMDIQHIARFAKIKGLNVVGTGDFTHPGWFEELKETLEPSAFEGLYTPVGQPEGQVYFMVTAEVCTISEFEGKAKRIHHVIWAPSLEVAEQVSDVLSRYGSLEADGRPTLTVDPPELAEVVTELSSRLFLFPAHAWTPWFSLFGAFSGFNRLRDCYQDMAGRVYALETGLSSDPPMNWRISELDRLAIISNSDSHSYWPWRLGREANVLEAKEPSYQTIIEVFKARRSESFLLTVETDPSYGKYHWTGHRNCGVSMPAKEAVRLEGICPVCGKRMTKGVEERVEELADRPEGYMLLGAPNYVHLIPLSEIIATALGLENPQDRRVWKVYNGLISRFGSEFNVLLDAPYVEVEKLAGRAIASLLAAVREDKVKIKPGYDGVYGKLLLEAEKLEAAAGKAFRRKGTLEDFF